MTNHVTCYNDLGIHGIVMCERRLWSSGRPVPVIAGLSDSVVQRQISDAPSVTFMSPGGRRRADVNLRQELDTAASGDMSAVERQADPVTEVTSTGTNTVVDVVDTEDQATETGQQHCSLLCFWVCLYLTEFPLTWKVRINLAGEKSANFFILKMLRQRA